MESMLIGPQPAAGGLEDESMPWPMFRRVERQAQHMSEMMERLEVDGAAAARHQLGASFAQARTTCLLCRSTADCSRWLRGAPDAEHPSRFCPNIAYFEMFSRRGSAR